MLNIKSLSVNHTLLSSLFIFLYSATILATGKSYSYIAISLCVVSLFYLPITLKQNLPSTFYKISAAFLGYFLITALSLLIYGGKLSNLDMPSRVLFILPAFIFLLAYPPKKQWVFTGIIVGSYLCAAIALYHSEILHIRAFRGFKYMVIQSGNIAMSLGIFSFIIAIHYFKENKSTLMAFAILAAFAGFTASLLSGARGSWIIAPLILIWVLSINRNFVSKKIILWLACILIVCGFISKDRVEQRVQVAVNDIVQFSEKSNSRTSLGARFEMWKSGVYNFTEHPIFGIGYGGRQTHNKELVDKKLVDPIVLKFGRLHNSYLEEASIKGTIGLITLLIFFIYPLYLFTVRKDLKHNIFAQLGVAHILLVMGYCLTQNYINHHSGMLQYLMYTTIFYVMFYHNRLQPNFK